MSLFATLSLDSLTAQHLWSALGLDTRLACARALYRHDWGQASTRREADVTVAMTLRFREQAVRQMPGEKRAGHLARIGNVGESLAQSLLLAFHLEERRPVLAAFLDTLGIAHDDGLIQEGQDIAPPTEQQLAGAASTLLERFPAADVELYLATLLALDDVTWGNLAGVLRSRVVSAARG